MSVTVGLPVMLTATEDKSEGVLEDEDGGEAPTEMEPE
jgi:hypothetical protein